jgi:hypothetical protein
LSSVREYVTVVRSVPHPPVEPAFTAVQAVGPVVAGQVVLLGADPEAPAGDAVAVPAHHRAEVAAPGDVVVERGAAEHDIVPAAVAAGDLQRLDGASVGQHPHPQDTVVEGVPRHPLAVRGDPEVLDRSVGHGGSLDSREPGGSAGLRWTIVESRTTRVVSRVVCAAPPASGEPTS